MKPQKIIILEKILCFMARRILKRYRPKVVAITGSVGKTTTKEMIFAMLSKFYDTRENIKNYNNEIGVPLTIIGARSGGHSIFGWLGVFVKWSRFMIFPSNYPQILVLEMGADRPGDIKYLTDLVPVDVGVVTNVGISHLEYFKTRKGVAKEKMQLVRSLPAGGLAVLNFDDSECYLAAKTLKANVIGYGFSGQSAMRSSDDVFSYESAKNSRGEELIMLKGISFKLNYQGKIIPVRLAYCLGRPTIYSALAAFCAATYFNINLIEAAKALEEFQPYAGRMSLIPGIKNTTIIDDTYNSSPDSAKAAIETVAQLKARRKIVALGDMLELGDETDISHQQVGQWVAESKADLFITVGKRMHLAAQQYLKTTNRPDLVIEFDSPQEAGIFLQEIMKEGDMVLVKGSQGMRMEKIVAEIMAEPDKKENLLVRQDKKWQQTEFTEP